MELKLCSCVAPSCSLGWVRIQDEERGGDRQSLCGRHLAPVTRAASVYRLVCQVCAGCSLEKVLTLLHQSCCICTACVLTLKSATVFVLLTAHLALSEVLFLHLDKECWQVHLEFEQ